MPNPAPTGLVNFRATWPILDPHMPLPDLINEARQDLSRQSANVLRVIDGPVHWTVADGRELSERGGPGRFLVAEAWTTPMPVAEAQKTVRGRLVAATRATGAAA